MYEIQIQAKEEFDGNFSDWTDPVFKMTWSNNDIQIGKYLHIYNICILISLPVQLSKHMKKNPNCNRYHTG